MANSNYNKTQKVTINEWKGEGIVKPRSGRDEDEIKFYQFKNGGGAIHITVVCSEPGVVPDSNGQPRMHNVYVPVNVMTNKNITQAQLQSIRPGTRVRVVGKLEPESYTKKSGIKVTTLAVNAFVFEVLAQAHPQMTPQYGMQPQYGGYPAQQPYQAPGGYPPPQQGYIPQPQYNNYPPQAHPQPQPQPQAQGGYPQPQGYGTQGQAPAVGSPAQPPQQHQEEAYGNIGDLPDFI